ncbi:MAG: DNA polymerase III subunit delta' [Gammaproteobacteria bacterium]|nr:DNA polymerase III subunit delta' [Gammaproteobacteria bacterium]
MDCLSAATMPWLAPAIERIRTAAARGRMPHSLLILGSAGLGAPQLAAWTAGFAVCEAPLERRPCGACAACRLLQSDTHPDLHVVRIEEDAKQIKVEQVRELIEALAQKSYRGGYKVGLIEGAEALNANGANAFLKTLEEPGADTLLIMTAARSHRLPATIASRCLRLAIPVPEPAVARDWLAAGSAGERGLDTALALAAGAPLLAQSLAREGLESLEKDMRESLRQLAAGSVDLTLLAEQWVRTDLPLRLRWLENWVTGRIFAGLDAGVSSQTAEPVRLPAALLKPKIRAMYALLDALAEFRRLAQTGMNQQLALEALLLRGRSIFS